MRRNKILNVYYTKFVPVKDERFNYTFLPVLQNGNSFPSEEPSCLVSYKKDTVTPNVGLFCLIRRSRIRSPVGKKYSNREQQSKTRDWPAGAQMTQLNTSKVVADDEYNVPNDTVVWQRGL
jgi:hypothetical protein